METKPTIFISCGQYTEDEKSLGKDICSLVRELCPNFEPYFAEDQSTVDGLSNHILGALLKSAGLICVMHKRGDIKRPDSTTITRGSVWIEQEIAIASAMKFSSGRSIPILFYKEDGVSLEGIRSVLLLNPRVKFKASVEVLDDLRAELPAVQFSPYAPYDLNVDVSHSEVQISPIRHDYKLLLTVRNSGQVKVDEFELRVWFPRAFLSSNQRSVHENNSLSTRTHLCLVFRSKQYAPEGLYPSDRVHAPIEIDYFVEEIFFQSSELGTAEIRYELYSGSMQPKLLTLPLLRYQNF